MHSTLPPRTTAVRGACKGAWDDIERPEKPTLSPIGPPSPARAHVSRPRVPAGARLRKVARKLRISRLIRIGSNDWYITANGKSHGVIRVRHGVIEELGIANPFLTRNYSAARHFLRSLP